MKVAVFSDLHLHPWQAFAKVGKDGLNSRLLDGYNVVLRVLEEAKKRECKKVLFCGDWVHVRKVPIEVYDLTGRILQKAKELELPVEMIPGNHDVIDEASSYHSLRALQPAAYLLKDVPASRDLPIVGIPYCSDRERLYEVLKRIDNRRPPQVLIIHAPLANAQAASDVVTIPGDDVVEPEKLLELVPEAMIFCGHYHTPQVYSKRGWKLADDADSYVDARIIIPGAPMQHSFADADEARGWWLCNTEKRSVKFIPIRDAAPEFKLIDLDRATKNPSLVKGNFVSFEVPEDLHRKDLLELKEILGKVSAGMRLSFVPRDEEERKKPRSKISPSMKPLQTLQEYAKLHPPPDEDRTIWLATEAINETIKGISVGE